jgi:hypothetical protein
MSINGAAGLAYSVASALHYGDKIKRWQDRYYGRSASVACRPAIHLANAGPSR